MDIIKTPKLENVQLLDKYNLRNPSKGTLYFATTHLIFVDHEMRKETWILLMHISSVDRLPITTTGSPLLVRTKTFQSLFFVIPRERDCHEMHQTLLRLSQPVHIDELYCFHYKSTPDDLPKSAGWNFFDIQTEYQRMNVPNDQWVLCTANKDYELCDTYPSEIYVPGRASTAVLVGSASFRSRGRLPVLAYLHHNKAAIARCSQPLSGFSARCMEDEQMLDLIRRANPNCGYMYVVDTRPRINAMVNRAAGKGYENEAFYENIKFQFMGIGNIHVMRKSLQKLVETCDQNTPTMSSFLSGLESSGWLKHIKSILDTSWWIACAIESGVSVCVHCSDGWDRTAQVCSLAALCLEPHYRTINGYQALIEKDWLSFGHKFTARSGHIACDGRERSPVFTQLLDCTWQLLRQRPEAFQFNERFLLTLHDHAHACQYGTFIGNCEKDRRDLRLSERTFSLWGYMASHLNEYKNPLYNPKAHPDVLKPDLNAQSIRFWRGMYCRHEGGVHPREPLADLLPAAVDHCSALDHHINYLAKRINTFKNLLSGKKAERNKETTVVNYQNGNVNSVEIETKIESLQIDNKLLYESSGTLSELECANHDHPLKEIIAPAQTKTSKIPLITEKLDESIPATLAQLEQEVNTVALDWKSVKNVTECSCSTPLDHYSRKHHCWGCGRCVCTRCVCGRAALPALASARAVPLCAACQPADPDPHPPDRPLHRFPKWKYPHEERFNQWKCVLDPATQERGNNYIYNSVRICHRHFEAIYKSPSRRLTGNAVPTLNIPSVPRSTQINLPPPKQYAVADSSTSDISQQLPTLTLSHAPVKREREPLTNEFKKLNEKLQKLQRKCKTQSKKILAAKKLSMSKSFLTTIEKLPDAAKTFIKLQIKAKNKPRGRRYTMEEKIMALTILKQSPKAYKLLHKMFVLPSKRCLQKLLSAFTMKPGVNKDILENLKKHVQRMSEEKKLINLLFDEISLAPGLVFNEALNEIIGFQDNGITKTSDIADHALVFMIKGIKSKTKQPISFTFSKSGIRKEDLKTLVRKIILELTSIGLKVISTICDQSPTNVAVIRELREETKKIPCFNNANNVL